MSWNEAAQWCCSPWVKMTQWGCARPLKEDEAKQQTGKVDYSTVSSTLLFGRTVPWKWTRSSSRFRWSISSEMTFGVSQCASWSPPTFPSSVSVLIDAIVNKMKTAANPPAMRSFTNWITMTVIWATTVYVTPEVEWLCQMVHNPYISQLEGSTTPSTPRHTHAWKWWRHTPCTVKAKMKWQLRWLKLRKSIAATPGKITHTYVNMW